MIHSAAAPREFGPKGNIPFAQTPREFFMRSVEVNVWSFWDLAMQVIPGMRKVRTVESSSSVSNLGALPEALLTKLKKHAWVKDFHS